MMITRSDEQDDRNATASNVPQGAEPGVLVAIAFAFRSGFKPVTAMATGRSRVRRIADERDATGAIVPARTRSHVRGRGPAHQRARYPREHKRSAACQRERRPPNHCSLDCLVSQRAVSSGSERLAATGGIRRNILQIGRTSWKSADAGGGTRTPDTRIMIPLL